MLLEWEREVGYFPLGGNRQLVASGSHGFLTAVTPRIDSHRAGVATLGKTKRSKDRKLMPIKGLTLES